MTWPRCGPAMILAGLGFGFGLVLSHRPESTVGHPSRGWGALYESHGWVPSSAPTLASPLSSSSSSRWETTPPSVAALSTGSDDTDVDDENTEDEDDHSTRNRNIGTIIGLQNLGNTCYLNAQIQCVYHIPLIRHFIINGGTTNDDENDEDQYSPATLGLRQLFQEMNAAHMGAVTTRPFCALLQIPTQEQQDTHEFWKLLSPLLQPQRQIMDLYTGTLEHSITATDGSQRERRFLEPFCDISLDITSSSSSSSTPLSVPEALAQQFTQSELLSVAAGNGWRPSPSSTPDEKVDAIKQCQLQAGPTILQLHLKRFQFDWQTETTTKLNHAVPFPLTLDLSSLLSTSDVNDGIYDLQSVIVHVGEYDSGHYYSYVRPNLRTDDWYRFNDEIHTRVRWSDVVQDATGGKSGTNTSDEVLKTGMIPTWFRRWFGGEGRHQDHYGYGGPKSSAYVLQYVRRNDIPKLYDLQ